MTTPSEQARADALADAETLWRNTVWYEEPAFEAARLGDWTLRAIERHPWAVADSAAYARLAARAAFSAVPGLRGGK